MPEPTFWRTEVWHPLTVHFPIALLTFATLVKLIAIFLKPASADFWQKAGSYLLYAGALAAWLSLYTGNLADGVVSRKLCDPTVLKQHQIFAEYLTYTFTAAALLDLAWRTGLLTFKPRLVQAVILLLLVAGTGFLTYAGHLGARVVYQQAGGVYVPSPDCAEFR
ncbi:DUF2231 domain-containing protein [Pontibacter flavimaris]|uniref:DUF2231 domain-containing protein n=1 Tax=Pontibacter flavimaris TaxID=1797110 RepID=A0A1Q5P981_9BACT|nr:DUF2231 domain-containing protein [Pontibacter flavimaris]OKL38754.1 hypothetical protein A3841_06355 [Pontibacter flavimaris]